MKEETSYHPEVRIDEELGQEPDHFRFRSLSGCSGSILSSCRNLKILYYDDLDGRLADLLQLQELEILHIVCPGDARPPYLDFLWADGKKQLSSLRKLIVYGELYFRYDAFYARLQRDYGVQYQYVHQDSPVTFMAEHDSMPTPTIL